MREKDKEMFIKMRERIRTQGYVCHIQSQVLLGWETKILREKLAKIYDLSQEIEKEIEGIFKTHNEVLPDE